MDLQQPEQLCFHFFRDNTNPLAARVEMEHNGQLLAAGELHVQSAPMPDNVHALKCSYDRRQRMQRAAVAQGASMPSRDERPLLALGRQIAGMLPAEVLDGLRGWLQTILQPQQFLHIILEFDPSAVELLGVPWELLALPSDETQPIQSEAESFVFLLGRVTLARRIRRVGCAAPAQLRRPLAVRAFCASPRQVEPIEIGGTLAAAGALEPPTTLKLDWYSGPNTLGALQQRLRSASVQIVHLLCHGEQSDTGRGQHQRLVLSDAHGDSRRTSASELARVLSLAPDLQLVLLQACHAGSAILLPGSEGKRPAVTGIALELLRAGVPAVIAMQGEVSQLAAAQFVESCYEVLEQGGSIERAVAAGRLAMYVADGVVDWSLPILYQGCSRAA